VQDAGEEAIDYAGLVREALVSVVRGVLGRVAENGLPGDHHFYLTFRTDAPGVELSERLRRQFPEELTIVLQHQFSGLSVDDQAFRVTLRFSGAPESLRVPWGALTTFADPAASFGLRLTPEEAQPVETEAAKAEAPQVDAAAATPPDAAAKPTGNVVAFRKPK
jgi:uncharacterized protein